MAMSCFFFHFLGPLPTRLTIKDWLEKKDEKTDGQKDDKGLRIDPRPKMN